MIGPDALEVYNTITWSNEDDKQKADIILNMKLIAFLEQTSHVSDMCLTRDSSVKTKP